MVREILERPGRPELLALEKHGRPRTEQQESGCRAQQRRMCELIEPRAGGGVGDLIVVLQIDDELRWSEIHGRRAAALLLPFVMLSLIKKSALQRRHELLRRSAIVRVVRLSLPGERDHGRM